MRGFLTQLEGYAHPTVPRSTRSTPARKAPRSSAPKPAKLSGAQAIARILATVDLIPEGRVATYGQIAFLAGLPGHARQVGFALRGLAEGSTVPWQRVVNAQGEISSRDDPAWEGFQRHLLEEEGVRFEGKGERGRVDLERFGWDPEPGLRPARKRRK
ncbi:MAG TPA: MGMT family protein [Thermoanaerobaculia bacterium]|jgi:methylated-DNA-protein-cysteine methyltransferase-like protein|nr:MGMT family protein [Thermoanaerobaculia bacterium]